MHHLIPSIISVPSSPPEPVGLSGKKRKIKELEEEEEEVIVLSLVPKRVRVRKHFPSLFSCIPCMPCDPLQMVVKVEDPECCYLY
jgi:hypothetical protein